MTPRRCYTRRGDGLVHPPSTRWLLASPRFIPTSHHASPNNPIAVPASHSGRLALDDNHRPIGADVSKSP
jgi:hypothetical protein